MDIKKAVFNWSSNNNLGLIVKFHDIIHGLFKEEYQAISKENINDPRLQDYDLLDEYLTVNTFLMIYSHAEEYFLHKYGQYNLVLM